MKKGLINFSSIPLCLILLGVSHGQTLRDKVEKVDGVFHLGTFRLMPNGDLEPVQSTLNDGNVWFRSDNEALSFYNVGTTATLVEDRQAEYVSYATGATAGATICGFDINYASNQANGTLQANLRFYNGHDSTGANNQPVVGGNFLLNLPTPGGTSGIFGYTATLLLNPVDHFQVTGNQIEYGLRMASGTGAFGPILQLNIPGQTAGQADSSVNATVGTTFNVFSLFVSPGQPTGAFDGNYWFTATGPWAGASLRLLSVPAPSATIDASYVIHNAYTGSGSSTDTGKSLHKETATPTALSYDNLINSAQGINGIEFDVTNLPGTPTASDFVFQVTSPGDNHATFGALGTAPTVVVTPGTPSKIRLTWPNGTILNRWLKVRVLANANTGIAADEVYYLGHLTGESGPTANPYVVAVAQDIPPIRNNVGNSANASNNFDINKDGLVTFGDISAMRSTVGTTLPNITVP